MYKEKWYYSAWFIALLAAAWLLIIPPIIAIILIFKRYQELKKARIEWENSGFDELTNIREKVVELETEYQQLSNKKQHILDSLEELKPIEDLSSTKQQLSSQINNLNSKKQDISNEIMTLQSESELLKDEILMQSFGFYETKYGLESSSLYKEKLDEIRTEQKRLVKEREATYHTLDWTIGNDKKKGKEFILDTIKLTLRAFNNECDNIISKVKFNNITASEKRLVKVFEDLNKLTDMQRVAITPEYLDLKLEELSLKYEFEQKKQEEKEEQQAIKEQMREEARALKELEKAKEKVEKEEKHFSQAIEKMNQQLQKANSEEQQKLLDKLRELEAQLELTKRNKEDVINRVQNTRAGYVYIISNIGSFGESVYKIGMTRRLEPLDRVKELGDASVPFTFDVHALIFSEDAPALESALHRALSDKKVNKVNDRKEFFRVDLKEIEELVKRNHNKIVEFTKLAEAEEFRKSVEMANHSLHSVS
ncbi:DUF4041 domain-containing protein [Priestia filamentosa]|uniref:DUF4041 domain-containing protein n=1 Tax=Priestia filamentosa TaxID=1402861 RepID=UPI002E203FBE|nr:DUF4041 domain-containing protein [Priestia filamentosa]